MLGRISGPHTPGIHHLRSVGVHERDSLAARQCGRIEPGDGRASFGELGRDLRTLSETVRSPAELDLLRREPERVLDLGAGRRVPGFEGQEDPRLSGLLVLGA